NRVLSTNPLLESFGNARTLRNDNSSRFGKFIKIQFSSSKKIVGATINNYLLEKTRICKQEEGERNYHIFYQLITGSDEKLKEKLNLSCGVSGFRYLTSPKGQSKRDTKAYEETKACLEKIGVTLSMQEVIFGLVAGVLHLGNVEFEPDGEDGTKVTDASIASLKSTCELVGLDMEAVSLAMTKRKIVMNDSTVYKAQSVSQATDKRDALSKLIYESLFLWLVHSLNKTISAEVPTADADDTDGFSPRAGRLPQENSIFGFIGVLDIYGFEHFDTNGFEQLLINYANESLQRHFNRHLFEVEQEEYAREGVDWTYISFNDNRPCLELLEGGSGIVGILQTLDDAWSGMGSSAEKDTKFVTQLHNNFGGRSNSTPKHAHYITPRVGFDNQFSIIHYAGEVKYTGTGFVDKNIETLSNELKDLGVASTIPLAKEVFQVAKINGGGGVEQQQARGGNNRRSSRIRGVSVATQFRISLQKLMLELDQTSPHYIRCIKPNLLKRPNALDSGEVLRQLRYAGMMETIRIRSEGYSLRESHDVFFEKFKILGEGTVDMTVDGGGVESLVQSLSKMLKVTDADWQVGHSKVFLRHQLAEKLEALTKLRQSSSARIIQRGYFAHRVWEAGALIVRWGKGRVMARRFLKLRKAATALSALHRMAKHQSSYNATMFVVGRLQTHARRRIAWRAVERMKDPFGGLTYEELKQQHDNMEQQLEAAIGKKDFEGAAALESTMGDLKAAVEAKRPMTRGLLEKLISEVKNDLESAVEGRRFAECGPLQAKMDELVAKREDLPTLTELDAKVKKFEAEVAEKSKNRDFAGAASAQKMADEWASKLQKARKEEGELGGEKEANAEEIRGENAAVELGSRAELDVKIEKLSKEVQDAVAKKDFAFADEKQALLGKLESSRATLFTCKQMKEQMAKCKEGLDKCVNEKKFSEASSFQKKLDELEVKYSEEKKKETELGRISEKAPEKKKQKKNAVLTAKGKNKANIKVAGKGGKKLKGVMGNKSVKDKENVATVVVNKDDSSEVRKLRPKKALTANIGDSVLSVCKMMQAKRCDATLIVREEGGLAGIVSDTDIVRRVVAKHLDHGSA
ncbi:hypothetical protein TrRE_jg10852, partial [Triparma retinervis]